MAALGEVPFGRYYGSVDATPLFVMLAGAYYERTGDRELARARSGRTSSARSTGSIATATSTATASSSTRAAAPRGLVQQGWKDSHDSVFHADGTLAEGPIALCEVQGYVYARASARPRALAAALGDDGARRAARAARPSACASASRRRSGARTSAPTRSRSTARSGRAACAPRTPAIACSTGIAAAERARRGRPRRCSPTISFSGWGDPHASAAGERRYNPMSYHNGSVWPHDNALIAAGLRPLRHHGTGAAHILEGLFDASQLHRRCTACPSCSAASTARAGRGPDALPGRLRAAGVVRRRAPYLLVASALGLDVIAAERRVILHRPQLPVAVDRLFASFDVAGVAVDLDIRRSGDVVAVEARTGNGVEVAVVA